MDRIKNAVDNLKKHMEDFQEKQEITVVCSSNFFRTLVNHWRMRVIYTARQEFSGEIVVVAMAPRGRWKLTGRNSGKTMKIKRGVRITSEMEPVFTIET